MESILSKHNEDFYKLEVEHGHKLDATIGYDPLGMSFRTSSRSLKAAQNYGHLSSFHSISEGMVFRFVQANVSTNLERI